jgi:uncharacterized protein (TIGR00269 family)
MNQKKSKCDICEKNSVITLKYGPHYFCENHFIKFFENRFKKTIRKYNLFKSNQKLVVALSGGKDSVVTLILLHKFYLKSNLIEAIIIDEGVKGYRNNAINTAKKICDERKIKYTLISFKKEFGITNDEMMPLILNNPKLGGTCAFCGTLRRKIMNKYAKKMNADKLITGHNLDDETQSIVMNIFNNDYEKFLRQNTDPKITQKNFVKRIKPLYETPENEIIAYCNYVNIPHYSDECCPYSWTAKRNEYREMLNNFENRFPGTEYSILRFFEKIKKDLNKNYYKKKFLTKCKLCGEPTDSEKCMACKLIEKIFDEKKKYKTKNKNKKKSTKNKIDNINKKIIDTKNKTTKYNKFKTCKLTKQM